jgi:integrase
VDQGFSTEIFNDERIKRILRGAARKYGKTPIRERLEITKDILRSLLLHLNFTHDDINLRAAFCTAFAGFLRMGEFTWSSWDQQSSIYRLTRSSVQFVNEGVILHLPASKTDPFRKGVSIPLSSSNDETCPVTALRTLFHRYPKPPSSPLFSRLCGPFNRQWALRKISQGLLFAGINPKGFTGHSFRRGAANSAFKAGISKADIMRMGRWKSDSIDRYFSAATTTTHLFSLSKQLHANPDPSTPAPSHSHSHRPTPTRRMPHRA